MDDQNTTDNQNIGGEGTADNNAVDLMNMNFDGSDNNKNGDTGNEPAPEAKNKNGDNGNGAKDGNADGGSVPAWTSQLPKEMRENADLMKTLGKFPKLENIAKSYSELESKLGKSLVMPGEGASEEEVNTFWQKLGKPESAEKYSIEGEQAKGFREIAFKNNLTDSQAKAIYNEIEETGKRYAAEQMEKFAQQTKETNKVLLSEYGKDFPAKMEMLKRGIAANGGQELYNKLRDSGLIADLNIVKLFINVGEKNAEAGTQNKSAKSGGYKSIRDGGTLSFGNDFK